MLVRADRLRRRPVGAPTRSPPAATRCSRRSPGCAARSAIRRRSSAATAATRSRSSPPRSTRSPCCATPRPRPRLLDAGDDRGAADLCASTLALLPRRRCCRRRRRRLGRRRTGRGSTRRAMQLRRDPALGPAAARRRRRRDRRAGGGGRDAPVPGGPVGAADHRAVPGRAPGRRAGGLPAGPAPAGRRARPRPRTAAAAARAADPASTTRRSAPPAPQRRPTPAGNLPSLSAELVGRDAELAALSRAARATSGSSRSSGRAASARRRSRSRPAGAPCDGVGPAASGWPGSRPRRRPTTSLDTVIAALNVTGGEAALFERLKAHRRAGDPRQLRARRRRRRRRSPSACSTPRPALRILCTSQVPLDVDGEAVFELAPLALADAVELFTRRAAPRATAPARRRRRGARPVPLARRSAAGDRARRGAHQDAVDRGDHPPPRRSLQRAERPDQPPAGAPPRAAGRRSGGATSCCSPTTSAACGRWPRSPAARRCRPSSSCSTRSTCPPSAAIDVVGRLASRSLVIVDDDGAGAVRYRLLDSIRAFALEAMADAGLTERALAAHAAWFADAAAVVDRRRAQRRQAEHLAFARAERANIDAALAWSAAHDPLLALAHRQRVRLGLDRPRRQPRRAADPGRARRGRRRGARPRDRAGALLLAAWIEASTGHLELGPRPHRRRHRARRRDRRRRPAGALLLLPRLRRVARRRVRRRRWS